MLFKKWMTTCAVVTVLAACSSSDDVEVVSNDPVAAAAALEWQEGVFLPSTQFEARCASPRDNASFDDVIGSAQHERMWLRSWSDETYLWFDQIPDQDPSPFSVNDYFDQLVTPELSPTGRPLDNFHFTFDTEEWIERSQSGISSGYGIQFAIDNTSPRSVRVLFVEPNASAATAPESVSRGARILSVDGVSVTDTTAAGTDLLNAGLFPSSPGETHVIEIQDLGSSSVREVSLVSEDVVASPVPTVNVTELGEQRIGYMLFNDHIATSEEALVDAVRSLSAQAIDELVLDLRYNGGGFLFIAAELGFMIAGTERTSGRIFELQQFNSRHTEFNPVTGARIQPVFFRRQAGGFSVPSGQNLPSLNLSRVYVLTGPGTCSASESVINGLLGIDLEVIQIGTTTCGKPFGFYPTDNCGTTYFTIQFRGVNDRNFGDFSDGFSPTEGIPISPAEVPGCEVGDDLEHQLGDTSEAKFAAALHHIETGLCPGVVSSALAPTSSTMRDPIMLGLPPWRTNKMMDQPQQ